MLFQPTNITPSSFAGTGGDLVLAGSDMAVTWQVNGTSPMTAYQIVIYSNNSTSTQLYSTGKVALASPFYGVDGMGDVHLFTATIGSAALSGAGIVAGNEDGYKYKITQWWSADDYVEQRAENYFIIQNEPGVAIDTTTITSPSASIAGTWAQSENVGMDWARWIITLADPDTNLSTGDVVIDSGKIQTQKLEFSYDGWISGTKYAVQLLYQLQNGYSGSVSTVVTAAWTPSEARATATASLTDGCANALISYPIPTYAEITATPTAASVSDHAFPSPLTAYISLFPDNAVLTLAGLQECRYFGFMACDAADSLTEALLTGTGEQPEFTPDWLYLSNWGSGYSELGSIPSGQYANLPELESIVLYRRDGESAVMEKMLSLTGKENLLTTDIGKLIDHGAAVGNSYRYYAAYNSGGSATQTGEIVSITDGIGAMDAEDITADIEPVQSGSGDPSPTNVRPITGWTGANIFRTGKNLVGAPPVSIAAAYGVSFSVNADNELVLSGTATATASPYASSQVASYSDMPLGPFPAGTYTITARGFVGTDSNDRVIFSALAKDGTAVVSSSRISGPYGSAADGTGNPVTFTSDAPFKIGFWIAIITGTTMDCTVQFQMERASSLGDYEPCQGESFEVDWTSEAGTVYGGMLDVPSGVLTVTHGQTASYSAKPSDAKTVAGKNLLDLSGVSSRTVNGVAFTVDAAAGTVTTSGTSTGAAQITASLTVPAGTYILSGGPANGIVGRGDIYVSANGSVVARSYGTTTERFTLSGATTLTVALRAIGSSGDNTGLDFDFFPMIRLASDTDGTFEPYHDWVWQSSMDDYAASSVPTAGAQVVYELATPVTYQLAAHTITTLLGTTNLWADTGNISVRYAMKPTTVLMETGAVSPCYWDWLLTTAARNDDGTYRVTGSYRFGLNLETGAISNNNAPTLLTNFTRYPTRQGVSANYRSGSLTAFIGSVDAENNIYVDTEAQADAILALGASTDTKFLRNRKGAHWMIDTAAATTIQTGDKYREQPYTATLSWVETGSAAGVPVISVPTDAAWPM